MSYREKSAWACLLTTIAVFVPYFAYLFRLSAHGNLTIGPVLSAFVAAVIGSIVLNVVAQMGVSLLSRREPKDERDLVIESRSFRIAYYLLASGSFLAILGVVPFAIAPALAPGAQPVEAILISQILLFCFVVAEAVRYLTQAVGYRRGS